MTRLLRLLLGLLAAAHLGRFVWLAVARRLGHPFALDWLEGACVIHARRVLDGEPLYAAPSLDFVPFIYTPLHFVVSAGFCRVLGTDFLALRLVSFLSALAAGALIYLLVRRSPHGTALGGLVAVGCFFAAYRVTGAWLDTARIDSLFLALLLAALLAGRSGRPWVRSGLAAVLMFLAFFTKQAALIVGLPLVVWSLWARRGRERWVYGAVLLGLVAVSTTIMDAVSDGWYRYYVFILPPQHPPGSALVPEFWLVDLLKPAAAALLLTLAVFWRDLKERSRPGWVREFGVFGALILASWLLRRHPGGWDNVLLPAWAGLAMMTGRAVDLAGPAQPRLRVVLTGLALLQLVVLRYPTGPQIPTPAARDAGQDMLARLAAIEGDVLMPSHPWALERAGRPPRVASMALWDLQRVPQPLPETRAVEEELEGMLARRAFAAVILDRPEEYPAGTVALDTSYVLVDSLWTPEAFTPVTGWPVRPRYLYVPRAE